MISFFFKFVAVVLLLFILGGFLRTWQMNRSIEQKLFLSGNAPKVLLNGFYDGKVPGHKVSWRGKKFESKDGTGINLFQNDGGTKSEKYPFVTTLGKGITDNNLDVLKIDYDIDSNPFWLRFILDEVVEVNPGQYLGKMQVRFIWSYPFTIGFFTLKQSSD